MEKYLIQILAFLRKRLVFIDGLVVLLFLTGALYFWILKEISSHVLYILKVLGLSGEGFAHFIFLFGLICAFSCVFWFWKVFRSVPKFKQEELGILFAPEFEEEIENEVNRLFINLKQEIMSHELGNRFSLKRLPANLSINSASEATAMLRDANGVVAVWGTIEQQAGDQGRTTGFSQISITFIHHPTIVSISRQEALAMSLVGRQFHTNERTRIEDRRIMARDIGIAVRNMLGVALIYGFKFAEAIKILGPLHANLQILFPGKKSLPVRRFCLQVQYDLAYSLTMATSEDYKKYLTEGILYSIPSSILSTWVNNVNQAISLDPQNSMHFISKAVYLFLIGDVEGAIIIERRAEKLAPLAVSVTNISLAFLYNFKGKFDLSRKQYRIGLAKKTSYDEKMISECLEFIRQTIDKFPEKKQLHLALAVLELRRGSKELGREALKKLLSDPPTEPELKGFVKEAENLLEQAKSNEEIL